MKVQIRDSAALSSISISSVRAYLNSNGWTDTGIWGERPINVFATERHGRTWEILVPHRDTIGGYAENMAETVAVLAAMEDRSQLDLFYDMKAATSDVIRLHSLNGVVKEPLSLHRSADLLNDAYDMVAAAARATKKISANYRGPLSSAVADYLDSVNPLPNDYDEYALTLHSPVSMRLGEQEGMGEDFYTPFPRRATLKLVAALENSNTAISEAGRDNAPDAFQKAVPYGVSSNLCDALAKLAKNGAGVEIGVTWAAVRPPSASGSPNPHFRFSKHSADILTEAAIRFRRDEPALDESVVAQVVKLERDPQEFDGRATLLWVREGRPTRLLVEFEKASYDTVINAFQRREPVSVDGDIYRVGNGYELRNPRNLLIIE